MNIILLDVLVVLGGTIWGFLVFCFCVRFAKQEFISASKEIVEYHLLARNKFIQDFENRVVSEVV